MSFCILRSLPVLYCADQLSIGKYLGTNPKQLFIDVELENGAIIGTSVTTDSNGLILLPFKFAEAGEYIKIHIFDEPSQSFGQEIDIEIDGQTYKAEILIPIQYVKRDYTVTPPFTFNLSTDN